MAAFHPLQTLARRALLPAGELDHAASFEFCCRRPVAHTYGPTISTCSTQAARLFHWFHDCLRSHCAHRIFANLLSADGSRYAFETAHRPSPRDILFRLDRAVGCTSGACRDQTTAASSEGGIDRRLAGTSDARIGYRR